MCINNHKLSKKYFQIAVKYRGLNDSEKEIEYLEKSVKLNNKDALFSLGQIYQNNNQIDKMLKLYITDLKNGNKNAKLYLGDYFKSINDIDNMVLWYTRAADDNIQRGILSLISHHKNTNEEKYLHYITYGSKLKIAECSDDLFEYYKEKKDYDNMYKLCLNSAVCNSAASLLLLGDYYKEINDVIKMIECYQLAGKKTTNDARTMYRLGMSYKTINDVEKSKLWFEMASKKNHVGSMYQLGLIYKLRSQYNDAIVMFDKCTDHGYTDAFYDLGECYELMRELYKMQQNYREALRHNENNINAMVRLYICQKSLLNYRTMNKWSDMIITNYDKINEQTCTKENLDFVNENIKKK